MGNVRHSALHGLHSSAELPDGKGARHRSLDLVLGAALITMSLVAGLNFTFMAAVMPNLAGVDNRTFVGIMQRFNENPVFPVSFTLALLLTILSVVLQASFARGPALRWLIIALALYSIVLAITGALHLPLNELISRAGDPDQITDLAHLRAQVESPWVIGNIVRTGFSVAALAALIRTTYLNGRTYRA
ncbi:DUF1772 domain-containing protein [Rhodococcus sp. NPDC058521]|uniref:anthrone oxygenase family protein n=1 Tax=Rhodococcus sp. NPDC058521 TaxID=3346536 RepID=UPI00366907E1